VKPFKQILLLIFCLQISLPSDLWFEIVDLPQLFSHFKHHNQIHEKIGFFSFVAKHYFDDSHQDCEHQSEKHEQLPFHHSHHNIDIFQHQLIAFFEIKTVQFLSTFKENFLQKIQYQSVFFPSSTASMIWRPPK
jgi:hypothetical protein